jgi:hypothetical protein
MRRHNMFALHLQLVYNHPKRASEEVEMSLVDKLKMRVEVKICFKIDRALEVKGRVSMIR